MFHFREYVKAESLAQAWELNQKKGTRILGGMLWLKMQDQTVQTAVDLSGLGLDKIEENDDGFSIGAMVSLRQLELHQELNQFFGGLFRESVKSIVGVQFRNLATVGGSLFGRFGFSDVLTAFLGTEAFVELYKGGIVPLDQFAAMEPDRDILVRVIVKKTPLRCAYVSHRNTRTDLPVLTCAVSLREGDGAGGRAVFGATPKKAAPYEIAGDWLSDYLAADEEDRRRMTAGFAAQVPTGTNTRAGKEYRSHLAGVLLNRALQAACNEQRQGGGTE